MRSPRLIGQWVFIKKFGDDEYSKVKILGEWKRNGSVFLRAIWESGVIEDIGWDAIASITHKKKAKIVPIKRNFKLIK